MDKKEVITPPNHIHLFAKKLFGKCGEIIDGSIAYLEPNGGGPVELHTHEHNHLFVVIAGQVRINLGNNEILLNSNESFLVDGSIPHSVWNNTDETAVMLGISVKSEKTISKNPLLREA